MELVKITDVAKQMRLSSRTLRYYEQVGLISSIRPKFETCRCYDEETVEQFALREEEKQKTEGQEIGERTVSYDELAEVSRQLARPVECSIVSLPPMRMLSSRLKENPEVSDPYFTAGI